MISYVCAGIVESIFWVTLTDSGKRTFPVKSITRPVSVNPGQTAINFTLCFS